MQVDDNLSEGFNTPALWTVDQNRLAIADKPPRRSKAQLPLVIRKEPGALLLRKHEQWWRRASKKAGHEWPFITDAKIETRCRRIPDDLAETEASRAPVVLDWTARLIASQPCREVFELISVGKDRREADDAALIRIPSTKEALNLNLISNFSLSRSDHVAFVEHKQANVIKN
ncbi:hypothetical protein BG58_05835 [Caballeronia jiangsuensis]|nr:hypothetical protein BG58_05835 [Caballeronia jiangsuensis]